MQKSVIQKGGNAVFAYRQSVDHIGGGSEQVGRSRARQLVVRAYGTAVLMNANKIDEFTSRKDLERLFKSNLTPQTKSLFSSRKRNVTLLSAGKFPFAESRYQLGCTVSARSVQLLTSP
jgi:hypothetical protein